MEVLIVRGAILVCICDVMDGTYGQDNLSNGVDNGQVNNSPVHREEEEGGGRVRTDVHQRDKIDEGQKSKHKKYKRDIL